ncbi:PadR family transcriptional regulator [Nocardiopsis salina]|uniref:PadR family transcriptional regulator n=1 Tax=Nocardiopsis salina TaxID=245836 RepID=UPI00047712FD|nr:PadR family transcriptional regulator [Nocardiopsis salina]
MSAIRLLVLGSVRHHGRAHGYQVRGDLEAWGAHEWSTAKPGSIYHALKQLDRQGLLAAHEAEPSAAGGPPRVVYSITEEGTHTFFTLLRRALSSPGTKLDVLSAGLGFMVDLPRHEVAGLLRERLDGLRAWHASVSEYYSPDQGPTSLGHIGEIMDLWVHTADSSAAWTHGLIERIEAGAHVFAGERGDPYEGVFTEEA